MPFPPVPHVPNTLPLTVERAEHFLSLLHRYRWVHVTLNDHDRRRDTIDVCESAVLDVTLQVFPRRYAHPFRPLLSKEPAQLHTRARIPILERPHERPEHRYEVDRPTLGDRRPEPRGVARKHVRAPPPVARTLDAKASRIGVP